MIYRLILALLIPVSPFGWIALIKEDSKWLDRHLYFSLALLLAFIVFLSTKLAIWIPKTAALFG